MQGHGQAPSPLLYPLVLVAEHVFAAHLTEFVVELEGESASSVPMGLRLVEGS